MRGRKLKISILQDITKYLENQNDLVDKGAMLENCYVLINVFGCSERYILEIERYGFLKE